MTATDTGVLRFAQDDVICGRVCCFAQDDLISGMT